MIFDKGNNSAKNIQGIDKTEYFFVASLKSSHHKELFKVSLERYEGLGDLKVYRRKKEVFGRMRTIVVSFNPKLQRKQLFRLERTISKERLKIFELKGKLSKGKWRSKRKVAEKITRELSKEGKKLLSITLTQKDKRLSLSVRGNRKEIYRRTKKLGKNIIFTDNHHWSSEEIIQVYKDKNVIEDNFKKMKNHSMVSFVPMWCWTDQKIRVHAFRCAVSSILPNLSQREVAKKYRKMSLEKIADKLSDIEETLFFYPHTMKPVRKLSEKDDIQEKLYQVFNLGEFSAEAIG